jgi:hypothetical protein
MDTDIPNAPVARVNFLALVRKKNTKWPSERGFSHHSWSAAWAASSSNKDVDKAIFEAGLVFDILFRELREAIEDIYNRQPKITRSQLILAYCGIANRDRAIVTKPNMMKGFDLTAIATKKNRIGNKISLQEIADGCVDSILGAIRSTIKRKILSVVHEKALDALTFMDREATISQLYGGYEAYWLALVWGDFNFFQIDPKNRIYEIRQNQSDLSISFEASQIRKAKLMAQSAPFVCKKEMYSLFKTSRCIDVVKDGKRKIAISKIVGDLDDRHQIERG